MADIAFRLTAGPYAGNYEIDLADISAADVGDLLNAGGPDLDAMLTGSGSHGTRVIAGLVWVVRRRANKGLAYRAVADNVNINIFEPLEEPAEGGAVASEMPDPSPSAAG